jgi:hypothetical protein
MVDDAEGEGVNDDLGMMNEGSGWVQAKEKVAR